MPVDTLHAPELRPVTARNIPALCDLAAAGLVQMFDPQKQVFCNTFARTDSGMSRQGISHRYTMMTLLGLHRYEASGQRSPIAIAPVLDSLVANTRWLTSTGDLGLLLWTCAELAPARLPQLYRDVDAENALRRFPDGEQGYTMEIAWFLTGLVACYSAGYSDLPGLSKQLKEARMILEANCGASGVYGHRARRGLLTGHFRHRIGTFADQVYPAIALARLSQVFSDTNARENALRTAQKMCALQGAMGEWSWHYDAARGKVISRYPVYSVHQHAMAPMMLFDVGEAANHDFSDAILKGLDWIGGNNELHRDFIERDMNLVWRCIYLRPRDAYIDAAMRFLELRRGAVNARLMVRYECRPYELGWLLYAFAGRKFTTPEFAA
jgi:hypothetical protein